MESSEQPREDERQHPTVPAASFSGKEDEPAGVDSVKITPEPGTALCRATAFAVRKCVRVYAVIGWPS